MDFAQMFGQLGITPNNIAQMFGQLGITPNNIAHMMANFRARLQPLKAAWVVCQFNQLKDLDEKFTFMWNLPETQECTVPPKLHLTEKSEDEAERFKTEGNILYKKHKFKDALRCYNMAILMAPHPKLSFYFDSTCDQWKEQQSLSSSDMKKFKTLGCSFANRSALFLAMKEYDKCLQDIDLALNYGYPELLKNKLVERKEKCLNAKKESLEDRKGYNSIPSRKRKAPVLSHCSETVPAFSSAMQVAYTKTEGRHVVATRNIHPGELIAVEEPLYICTGLNMLLNCSVCLVSCNNPLPCPNCMDLFCSDVCRTRALRECQGKDCGILVALRELGMNVSLGSLLKMLLRTSFAGLKEQLPELKREAKELPPEKRGFNKDGIYYTDYRALYHMSASRVSHLSEENIFNMCFTSVVLTKLLYEKGDYFINSLGLPILPNLEDFVITGATILHHMVCPPLQLGLQSIVDDSPASAAPVLSDIGEGLFPAFVLMKHSCNPSAFSFNIGSKMTVRALKFIPAGKQVTISYGPHFHNEHKISRKIFLDNLGVNCLCEACENNWPLAVELSDRVNFKCPKCSKAVKGSTCIYCDIDYKRRDYDGEKKSMVENWHLNFHQFVQIEKQFKISAKNIGTKQVVTKEDFEGVRIFIEFVGKYIELPCTAFVDAQRFMFLYFLKE